MTGKNMSLKRRFPIAVFFALFMALSVAIAVKKAPEPADPGEIKRSIALPSDLTWLLLSPDERWICYERKEKTELYIVSWDGRHRRTLPAIDSAYVGYDWMGVEFAPNSSVLVYIAPGKVTVPYRRKLAFIDLAKGSTTLLSKTLYDTCWPSWSPDGKTVAVIGTVKKPFQPDLPFSEIEVQRAFIVSPSGKVIAHSSGSGLPRKGPPAWSPDGRKLLLLDWNAAEWGSVRTWDIATGKEFSPTEVPFPGEDRVFGARQGHWLSNDTVCWTSLDGIFAAHWQRLKPQMLVPAGGLIDFIRGKEEDCMLMAVLPRGYNPSGEEEGPYMTCLGHAIKDSDGRWYVHWDGVVPDKVLGKVPIGDDESFTYVRWSRVKPRTIVFLNRNFRLERRAAAEFELSRSIHNMTSGGNNYAVDQKGPSHRTRR